MHAAWKMSFHEWVKIWHFERKGKEEGVKYAHTLLKRICDSAVAAYDRFCLFDLHAISRSTIRSHIFWRTCNEQSIVYHHWLEILLMNVKTIKDDIRCLVLDTPSSSDSTEGRSKLSAYQCNSQLSLVHPLHTLSFKDIPRQQMHTRKVRMHACRCTLSICLIWHCKTHL